MRRNNSDSAVWPAEGVCGAKMLLRVAGLCALVAAAAGETSESIFLEERSYIEAFEAPRLDYTLSNYMREPGMLLELSRPAFAMEVIRDDDSCGAVTGTDELRERLFTQTVAVSNRPSGSAITMLYAGMDDGRFIGCAN